MKKKILISVALLTLIGISILLFHDRLFKPSIHDITSEKGFTIQNQEEIAITLSVPKPKLSEAIYTSEGQLFSENEIVAYETDTTTIYLEKAMLSNESDEQLYFMFNCAYDLPEDGVTLVPYKKNDNETYSYVTNLESKDLTDDTTAYPDAVGIKGCGPSAKFVFYVSADICQKAVGTINIDISINQITYMRTQ